MENAIKFDHNWIAIAAEEEIHLVGSQNYASGRIRISMSRARSDGGFSKQAVDAVCTL